MNKLFERFREWLLMPLVGLFWQPDMKPIQNALDGLLRTAKENSIAITATADALNAFARQDYAETTDRIAKLEEANARLRSEIEALDKDGILGLLAGLRGESAAINSRLARLAANDIALEQMTRPIERLEVRVRSLEVAIKH